MECPTEGAAADPTARSFSQVVFTDIPHSYPPSANVTCSYTLTSAFQPNARDWVGIFKVGWSSTKDYQTFVWVEPCLDVVKESVTKQAVFKEYYLPKDDIEFYQFCYIDSTGQVRGASTPFCFKNPMEQSLESSPDDDLLVITTQEQVEQSVREKAGLMKELDQIREENETLKSALKREQQEVQNLKDHNEQKVQQMKEIVTEMDQIKEENQQLKNTSEEQLKETDRLKEEMMIQMMKAMALQQQNMPEQMTQSLNVEETASQNEKYDRAVMKINQLKEEREELRKMNDTQSAEIDQLKSKLKEEERELFKMKDNLQLLQVDLQSSNKEKVRWSSEMQKLQSLLQNMEEENKTIRRSLSQQEVLQMCPDDDLMVQCQALQEQLSEEKKASRKLWTQKEAIEDNLTETRNQLQTMASELEDANRRCSKQELKLTEANAANAEKDVTFKELEDVVTLLRQEMEELTQQNQNLHNEIEHLRGVYAESHHRQPEPPYEAVDTPGNAHEQEQNASEQPARSENVYENIDNITEPEEEPCLVCRHCQESFPGITESELDQHEQSHRVCPFCTIICDDMEQAVFEDHVYSHEL